MWRRNAVSREVARSIDVGEALDLLAVAVAQRGRDLVYPPVPDSVHTCVHDLANGPASLVRYALALAQVSPRVLDRLLAHRLRDLFAAGLLPVPMTLGAVVVLDAAERAQDRGRSWGEALVDAQEAAARLLDILPDRAFGTDTMRPAPRACRTGRVPG